MREEIIKEARRWIGVKYQHQGRDKELGCDCLGLIIEVLKEVNINLPEQNKIFAPQDFRRFNMINYSQNPYNYELDKELSQYFTAKKTAGKNPVLSDIKAGDIILFKFRNNPPQHLAFASEILSSANGYHNTGSKQPTIIHSYKNVGKVVEHRINKFWLDRVYKLYDLPDVFF